MAGLLRWVFWIMQVDQLDLENLFLDQELQLIQGQKFLQLNEQLIHLHNPALVMIGASMLWVGWFGFNAGSALAANEDAGMAYGLVLYAKTMAPLGMVSALRETSVIFAAMIGLFWFGEGPARPRLSAAVIVTLGIVLLSTA